MIFSKVSKHIESLNQDLRAYIDAKLQYFELKFVKRATIVLSKMAKGIVALLFFLMFIGMISVAIAIFVGQAIGNIAYGFLIIAGAYLVALILLLVVGKKMIQRIMIREVSREVVDFKEDMDLD